MQNVNLKTKTVLVVDGGGRGSVLVDKYLQSKYVQKVIAIPGNDLMVADNRVEIYPSIKTTDIDEIQKICKINKVDLVDVAQDDVVAIGLTDTLKKTGITVFGPSKKAGQIEWDKSWSKNFMQIQKIPTAKYQIFNAEASALKYIKTQAENQWYIKASGLAGGKGAIYAKNKNEAISAIGKMKNFGIAGKTFLIEECLQGEEFSSFAIVSGKNFQILGHAQDHKTAYDGNLGPNTGGMGCSSPPLVITEKIEKQIKSIFKKTVEGLVKIKTPYLGILYLGGIVDSKNKVKIIEFNARWGDPEAQVVLPSIKNDYLELILSAIKGKLKKVVQDKIYRVVVTAASKGYPGDTSKVIGKKIKGLDKIIKSKTKIYGAQTKMIRKKYTAAGGRLFYVLGEGKNVAEARKKAYNVLSKLSIIGNNLHFRKDIGYRDLERLNKKVTIRFSKPKIIDEKHNKQTNKYRIAKRVFKK